ncbi:CPBP family intramembrane metalloprotease [bacterium BD-1]|nr:CPBP family intramembrane metalloprotease [Ottowia caeni]
MTEAAMRPRWPWPLALLAFAAIGALWLVPGLSFPWRGGLVALAVLAATWAEYRSLRPLGLAWPLPRNTLAWMLGAFVVLELVMDLLVQPGIAAATGEPTDYSAFAALQGNTPTTLRYLAGMWLSAALAEELYYRGQVFLLADRLPAAARTPVAVLGGALLFAAPHAYQGLSGLLVTFAFGLAFAGVFLLSGRNLWVTIGAHGLVDTLFLLLAYTGGLSWYA